MHESGGNAACRKVFWAVSILLKRGMEASLIFFCVVRHGQSMLSWWTVILQLKSNSWNTYIHSPRDWSRDMLHLIQDKILNIWPLTAFTLKALVYLEVVHDFQKQHSLLISWEVKSNIIYIRMFHAYRYRLENAGEEENEENVRFKFVIGIRNLIIFLRRACCRIIG